MSCSQLFRDTVLCLLTKLMSDSYDESLYAFRCRVDFILCCYYCVIQAMWFAYDWLQIIISDIVYCHKPNTLVQFHHASQTIQILQGLRIINYKQNQIRNSWYSLFAKFEISPTSQIKTLWTNEFKAQQICKRSSEHFLDSSNAHISLIYFTPYSSLILNFYFSISVTF